MLTVRLKPDTTVAFVCAVAAALGGVYLAEARQQPPREGGQTQPPIFRGGTTLVQVDAIVADSSGQPLMDLAECCNGPVFCYGWLLLACPARTEPSTHRQPWPGGPSGGRHAMNA